MSRSQLILQKHNMNASSVIRLDFIYQEIARRMLERLDYIKISPQIILDIGSGLGIDSGLLGSKFPKASVLQLDNAINMLKFYRKSPNIFQKFFSRNSNHICADALHLPIENQSIDMVWSNLCLPYICDMEAYFKEIRRVLRLGGCFFATGLGVDSLLELREIGLQTFNFPDMHMIGDILVKLGFSHPVTDLEYIKLEYDSFADLLADVRIIGCGGTTSYKWLGRENYNGLEEKFVRVYQNGKVSLTLEVFCAHAWVDNPDLSSSSHKKILFYPRNK